MSLPTGQQRVLEKIEGRLAQSDPRLVSLFTIFTRLTLAEKMPWIEQIRARPVAYRIGRIGAWFRGIGRRPAARELVIKSRAIVGRARICRMVVRMPAFAC